LTARRRGEDSPVEMTDSAVQFELFDNEGTELHDTMKDADAQTAAHAELAASHQRPPRRVRFVLPGDEGPFDRDSTVDRETSKVLAEEALDKRAEMHQKQAALLDEFDQAMSQLEEWEEDRFPEQQVERMVVGPIRPLLSDDDDGDNDIGSVPLSHSNGGGSDGNSHPIAWTIDEPNDKYETIHGGPQTALRNPTLHSASPLARGRDRNADNTTGPSSYRARAVPSQTAGRGLREWPGSQKSRSPHDAAAVESRRDNPQTRTASARSHPFWPGRQEAGRHNGGSHGDGDKGRVGDTKPTNIYRDALRSTDRGSDRQMPRVTDLDDTSSDEDEVDALDVYDNAEYTADQPVDPDHRWAVPVTLLRQSTSPHDDALYDNADHAPPREPPLVTDVDMIIDAVGSEAGDVPTLYDNAEHGRAPSLGTTTAPHPSSRGTGRPADVTSIHEPYDDDIGLYDDVGGEDIGMAPATPSGGGRLNFSRRGSLHGSGMMDVLEELTDELTDTMV